MVIRCGEANSPVLFLHGRGLPRLGRPRVAATLVAPAVAVEVGARQGSRRHGKHASVLVTASLFGPANLVVLFQRRVIGVGHWNVVSLTTSHTSHTGCHLFVLKKLSAWMSLFLNFSSPIGLQVLEVVDLLLTARFRPTVSEVFMCQQAMFCREAELNISSPQHTAHWEATDRLPLDSNGERQSSDTGWFISAAALSEEAPHTVCKNPLNP